MQTEQEVVQYRLQKILHHIRECERRADRPEGSVQLLAASKLQSSAKIRAAYEAGQRLFGENYLQEALQKMADLQDLAIEWHFIGPIQSNKTRKIAEHFHWVHSVDDKKIADRLNEQRPPHLSALNICLEVNVSGEATKSGISPENLFALAAYCSKLPRIKLRGLMTIPAIEHDSERQHIPFRALRILWEELRQKGFALDTLSMGMTDDYAAAIAEGATVVRIGTGIFGQRISF